MPTRTPRNAGAPCTLLIHRIPVSPSGTNRGSPQQFNLAPGHVLRRTSSRLAQLSLRRKFRQFDDRSMTRAIAEQVGARRLSAIQRVATIAKLTTLLSAVLTILCAAAIVGVQVTGWFRTGTWGTYRLGSVIRSLKSGRSAAYVTASVGKSPTEPTSAQVLVNWFLEIPTTTILLAVAALHFAFYLYIVAFEKQQNLGGHRRQSDAGSRRRFW
jgi:hypothetical protein